MSRSQIASYLNVSYQTLQKWENDICDPTIINQCKLISLFYKYDIELPIRYKDEKIKYVDTHIFDNLIKFIIEYNNNVVILHFTEIAKICSNNSIKKAINSASLFEYAKLAKDKFEENGFSWIIYFKDKIIVFKKIGSLE